MRKIQLAAIPLISATLFACGMNSDNTSTPSAGNDFSFAYQSISDATLKAHTKTLASDEFEGRSPTIRIAIVAHKTVLGPTPTICHN